jgi:RNA 3'-terminal phosphate cyclase (ATP)
LAFDPGPIIGGKYEFDIGTAGSVTLVAQTLMPILFKAEKGSHLRIVGGTHVMKSPSFDYFDLVFLPGIGRFGAKAKAGMLRPGYYPRGGGVMEVEITPSQFIGTDNWKSDDEIHAIIRVSGLPESIAIREKKIFVQNECGRTFIRQDEADSVGNAVTAWKGLRGSCWLGEKGKRAEIVGQEAYDALQKECGDVDMHLADQLLIYAALSSGSTRYATSSISEHLKTNAFVISRFLDREIKLGENGEVIVS